MDAVDHLKSVSVVALVQAHESRWKSQSPFATVAFTGMAEGRTLLLNG